ncbi:hypothetical protein RYX36_007596 [Vicia faba]
MLREFYSNDLPSAGKAFSFTTKEGYKCRYQESINARPYVATISKRNLLERRSVERNASSVTIRFHREDLVSEAQVLILFILNNLRPRSHTSTFTLDTTQLLYLIMSGKRIDVAQIIANDMRNVAKSGKEFGGGIKSTYPMVYLGIIMGLIISSRVRIPNTIHVKIKTKVNDTYIDKFCLEKKKK